MFTPHVNAAQWLITPTFNLRETYTNNVRLAASGLEQSDFITDISPGLHIAANGPGLKLRTDYTFQYLRYARDNIGSTHFHKLSSNAKAELVKNLFYVDGRASINQQGITLLGTNPTSNYDITDNRTTVKTFNISPYLRHDFGSSASTELRYTHSSTSSDNANVATGHTDGVSLGIDSGQAFRRLGWGLHYSSQKVRMGRAYDVDSSTSSGNLRLMVTPHLYLTAEGGYDKYNYVSSVPGTAPEGRFYTGGFSWRPTERTSITANAGRRFYGKTYSLDSSVRSRHSVWHLSYNERISSTPAEFALNTTDNTSDLLNQLFRSSIPDDELREQAVERFILETGLPATLTRSVNYFSRQFFLQKTLRASVAITGAKNTIVLTATRMSRDPQSVLDPSLSPAVPIDLASIADTRQIGTSLLWNWKLSGNTNANFMADFHRTKLPASDTQQNYKMYRVSLTRKIQPKLTGILELKHANTKSEGIGINYNENAVTASVVMKY